jgi:hypothetical protein
MLCYAIACAAHEEFKRGKDTACDRIKMAIEEHTASHDFTAAVTTTHLPSHFAQLGFGNIDLRLGAWCEVTRHVYRAKTVTNMIVPLP